MKKTIPGSRQKFNLLLLFILVVFTSCKTTRELPVESLKPLPVEKLLNLVEYNAFEYSDLTIKRIQVQFSNSSTKNSFRASIKAVKNDGILASISKMNIPLGRVLLTPDSVTYVNYIDKNFLADDYSFLSNYFNLSLDFETIQAILSNNVFLNQIHVGNSPESIYDTSVENGRYVLQTAGKQNGVKTKGIFNRLRSSFHPGVVENQEKSQGMVRKMYFNRRNYSLERLLIDDSLNRWKLEVDFNDFVKIEKKEYPGSIDIKMTSPEEVVDMKIKLNGFSTDKIESVDLNIPGSYRQIQRY
ncbi:MAG: DUF4292 domain-containing protein [Mariniphaga sp.]